VDVDKFKYNGWVEITIRPEKDVQQVTLHSNGLNITNADISFYRFGLFRQKWGKALDIGEDKNLTTITVYLQRPLIPGYNFTLRLDFEGEIRKELYGLYRSSYKIGNETR